MGKSKTKRYKQVRDGSDVLQAETLTACIAEAVGQMPAIEPVTGEELRAEVELSLGVTADEANAALEKAYANKSWLTLFAGPTDLAFEADQKVVLRVDSRGHKLAMSADDVKGRGDIEVTMTAANGDPIIRRVSGALWYNKLRGLTRAAERIISDSRCNSKAVRNEAEYLRISMRDKDAEFRKSVLKDFYSAYRVQLPKGSAEEFLKLKEPRSERPSRKEQVAGAVGAKKVRSLDELIARKEAAFKASQAAKA